MNVEKKESIGRIEVAPEVIMTIARYATLNVDGVAKMGTPSASLFRRGSTRQDGVMMHYEDGNLVFDVYLLTDSNVNMMETSRSVQKAVFEAMDQMVGVPVEAVNVHVEDVAYKSANDNV